MHTDPLELNVTVTPPETDAETHSEIPVVVLAEAIAETAILADDVEELAETVEENAEETALTLEQLQEQLTWQANEIAQTRLIISEQSQQITALQLQLTPPPSEPETLETVEPETAEVAPESEVAPGVDETPQKTRKTRWI